jgi:small subunit ribosomal protein S17
MAQTKTTIRDIGIDVPAPQGTCSEAVCPFHGSLKVRGAQIVGNVVSIKMQNTAVIQKERHHYVPKYERYERRTGRYAAHAPPCLGVQEGDIVRIAECRPLSKTVSFVVIERRPPQ